MTLLARTAEILMRADMPFALIGAAAMAAHGVSRSTIDQDLLVTDARVLDPVFWSGVADLASIDIRRGDASDPLLGVVRFSADDERQVDVIVGRGAWMSRLLTRAAVVTLAGAAVPVAGAADIILLKLYAAGSQDLWDVEQLLAASPDPSALQSDVEHRLADAPRECGIQWRRLRPAI